MQFVQIKPHRITNGNMNERRCQLSGSQLTCRGTMAATHVLRLRIEERPRSWTEGSTG